MTEQDELVTDVLTRLREMQGAYAQLETACRGWVHAQGSGLDPAPHPLLDERSIVQEHLDQIRRAMDDLLRMLAAVKGKAALAALVQVD